MGAAAGVAMVDTGAGQALAEESARAVGEDAIEKFGDGLVAEAHGAQGNADDVILATAVEVGRRPDRRGEQGDAAALSRQRAQLGGPRRALCRAGRQDRLARPGRRPPAWHSVAVRKDYFAGSIAENYDDDSSPMFDPAVVGATVDFLADLAGDGAALELGIGTGRIALPLSARACRCTGSTSRPTWWRSCGPSPVRRPSA